MVGEAIVGKYMEGSKDVFNAMVEMGLWSAFWGALGGLSRLLAGVGPQERLWVEIARIVFIAMPVGWLVGPLLIEQGFTDLQAYGGASVSGVMALNLVRGLSQLKLKELLAVIRK